MAGMNLRFEVLKEIPMKTLRMLVEEVVEQEMDKQQQEYLLNAERTLDLLRDTVQERFQNLELGGEIPGSEKWVMKWYLQDGTRIVVFGFKPKEQIQDINVRHVIDKGGNWKSKRLQIPYPIDENGIAMIVGAMEQVLS